MKEQEAILEETEGNKKITFIKTLLFSLLGAFIGFLLWQGLAVYMGGNLHVGAAALVMLLIYVCRKFASPKNNDKYFTVQYLVIGVLFCIAGYLFAKAYLFIRETIGADMMGVYADTYHGGNMIKTYFSLYGQSFAIFAENIGFYLQDVEILKECFMVLALYAITAFSCMVRGEATEMLPAEKEEIEAETAVSDELQKEEAVLEAQEETIKEDKGEEK
ncbi:MAG: hypothetical protein ACOX3W_02540 [Christensenellaceae bacterium]|jgi:hypothetical protein